LILIEDRDFIDESAPSKGQILNTWTR